MLRRELQVMLWIRFPYDGPRRRITSFASRSVSAGQEPERAVAWLLSRPHAPIFVNTAHLDREWMPAMRSPQVDRRYDGRMRTQNFESSRSFASNQDHEGATMTAPRRRPIRS